MCDQFRRAAPNVYEGFILFNINFLYALPQLGASPYSFPMTEFCSKLDKSNGWLIKILERCLWHEKVNSGKQYESSGHRYNKLAILELQKLW